MPKTCIVSLSDQERATCNSETRKKIKATKAHPERIDYEYVRGGTASIFTFADKIERCLPENYNLTDH
jgi:hypothetical protein